MRTIPSPSNRAIWQSGKAPFALLICVVALALSCGGGGGGSSAGTVKVQLDWTPNTNHIGIYIAQAKGWYKDAGVEVEILPYADVNPDTVLANGQADVAIGFPPNLVFSRAAGLDLVSIAAVLQKNTAELAVLDSSEIKRPRDMDGKLYAGFGLPYEEPQIKAVITTDGGRGEFDSATLSTAAYEALYNKRADFAEIFVAWEGIEAQMRGIKLRTFRYEQYGVPDFPSVVLLARANAVTQDRDKLTKFLEATKRGYEYAAKNPEDAANVLMDALPDGTFPEPEMVRASTKMLAPVYVDSSGKWGTLDGTKVNAYSKWLLDKGVVTDGNDKVVTALAGGPLFTNDLLPK